MGDKFYTQRIIVSSKMLGYSDKEISRMINDGKSIDTKKLEKKDWYDQLKRCYENFDRETLENVRKHALCMNS